MRYWIGSGQGQPRGKVDADVEVRVQYSLSAAEGYKMVGQLTSNVEFVVM
jgi:hypothetical protein